MTPIRASRSIWITAASALLLTAAPACEDACEDQDGDERGEGCERGPDCDDTDPRRALRCIDVPERCEDNPTREGCPCLPDLDDSCYEGPAETLGVGSCKAGRADCAKGLFLACSGATIPGLESCNDLDDDCDGVIDERVASPCGGCNDACIGAVWGPPVASFEVEPGFAVTEAGELTLAVVERERQFVWVPNTGEGTVSKLDAERAVEIARYRTPGGRPARVAVDHRGDVWVLDVPLGTDRRARLGKIASEHERCRDRDGDGLETSDGPLAVLAQDECWLLDFEAGEPGDEAQALAIDGAQAPDAELAGNPWVGFARAERLIAYDGDSGVQLLAAALPGFAPWTGSFDAWGVLWLIDRDGKLARVDPVGDAPSVRTYLADLACYTLEGLSIDRKGQLWFAGFGCENVVRFDPATARWVDFEVPGLFSPRAITQLGEAPWVVYTSGQLARVDREPLGVSAPFELAFDDRTPFESVALAADSGERLWVVSTRGGPDGRGLASRFDPARGVVDAQVAVGVDPSGGGDLTGLALGVEFVREATTSRVFEGECNSGGGTADNGTLWKAVRLLAQVGAGGSVEVAVRWAEERGQLAATSFNVVGVYPDDGVALPLRLPEGGTIEVQLTLRAARANGAPRVARVGIEWTCAGPD